MLFLLLLLSLIVFDRLLIIGFFLWLKEARVELLHPRRPEDLKLICLRLSRSRAVCDSVWVKGLQLVGPSRTRCEAVKSGCDGDLRGRERGWARYRMVLVLQPTGRRPVLAAHSLWGVEAGPLLEPQAVRFAGPFAPLGHLKPSQMVIVLANSGVVDEA